MQYATADAQREIRTIPGTLSDAEVMQDPTVAGLWNTYRRHACAFRALTPEIEAEGIALMARYGRVLRQIQGRDEYKPKTPEERESLAETLANLRCYLNKWVNPDLEIME